MQTFTIGECPDLGVAVTPLACSTDRNGEALLTLTGLASGIITYDVQGPNFAVGGSLDEFGETEEIDLVGMPPGNYFAYVEWTPVRRRRAPAGAGLRLGRLRDRALPARGRASRSPSARRPAEPAART